MTYIIKVKGALGKDWSDWLGASLTVLEQDDHGLTSTILTIQDADQPALFGTLDRIRDLNLVLISVNPGEGEEQAS